MALVVKSAVRDVVSKMDMRISGDLWDALDEKVKWKLKKAVERAKANGRKTLKPEDL